MTKSQKKAIIDKAVELGFKNEDSVTSILEYKLPLGNKTELWFDYSYKNYDVLIWSKELERYIPIRKVESPEDLEILFNAICPEKFRLPFD